MGQTTVLHVHNIFQAVQQVLSNLLISHIEIRTEESNSIDIKQYSHERIVDKVVVPLGIPLYKHIVIYCLSMGQTTVLHVHNIFFFLQAVQQVLSNLLISHIEIRTEESIDIKQYSHERIVDKVVVPLGEELTKIKDKYVHVSTGKCLKHLKDCLLFEHR